MQINVRKSSIMWFKIKQPKPGVSPPSVCLDGLPLSCVEQHRYLGVHFDSQLSWDIHVANICKKMSYYLYLMNYHHRVLPSRILRMLADSLIVPQLTYALSVWGPSLKVHLSSRLHCLYNRAVRITCGLQKYDHVSDSRHTLWWLSLDSLVKHRALGVMYRHYTKCDCVVFNPPIQFGLIICMILGFHPIFVVFLAAKLVLDSVFLDQELLIGGTVYPLHYLMLHSELIFHGSLYSHLHSVYCVFYMYCFLL